jgi:hypothetical protein
MRLAHLCPPPLWPNSPSALPMQHTILLSPSVSLSVAHSPTPTLIRGACLLLICSPAYTSCPAPRLVCPVPPPQWIVGTPELPCLLESQLLVVCIPPPPCPPSPHQCFYTSQTCGVLLPFPLSSPLPSLTCLYFLPYPVCRCPPTQVTGARPVWPCHPGYHLLPVFHRPSPPPYPSHVPLHPRRI